MKPEKTQGRIGQRKITMAIALAMCALAPAAMPSGAADAQWTPAELILGDNLVKAGAAPCSGADPVSTQLQRAGAVSFTDDPGAGDWATWYVAPADIPVSAAPATLSATTAEELAELHQIQVTRTNDQVLLARAYDGVPTHYWNDLFLDLIIAHADKNGVKNPPILSRQIGLLEQAMYDALVVTWGAKYCYERLSPATLDPALLPVVEAGAAPSYPSEHAAVAGAAAVMMAHFFPPSEEPEGRFDNTAREIAESRLWGGANYRSDVEAGLAIGYAVGNAILAERLDDGSDLAIARNITNAPMPPGTGLCHWTRTLPSYGGPLLPAWGKIEPFIMASPDQFLPPPPPECDGATYIAQTRDLYDVSLERTTRQIEIADRWAGGQGTVTPPGQWLWLAMNVTAEDGFSTMRQARVMSYMGAALADAGISAWNTKYTFWGDRPIHGIRRHWDPEWDACEPCHTPTPPFPGYVSGHSTFGGAAMTTLAHFFPEREAELSSYASEAALSRFYGGIHIRADNDWGLWAGEGIGTLAAMRASQDGAE